MMKRVQFVSALLVFAVFYIEFSLAAILQEKFAWKEVDYAWESESQKEEAVTSGRYIVENNLPLGLDVWRDKLFITVPRWKSGVASSLNYVKLTNELDVTSPILHPYPNWQANTIESNGSGLQDSATGRAANGAENGIAPLADNSSIISTFRIRVDECDRLWVMDTGLINRLRRFGNPKQISPPALVIFNLNTDELIRRYAFTSSDSGGNSKTFYGNVIVDIPKNECDNAYAYVPDLMGNALVVYSFKDNKSWRVEHSFFNSDPESWNYNIAGQNFQWTDGVFGMALGKPTPEGSRSVYFHALSSTKEFSVPNYVLQNESYAKSKDSYGDYTYIGDRGQNGQSTAEFFDEKNNVLFYTQISKNAIGCWNADKPYNKDTQGIVDSNSDSLVFPNDLKLDKFGNLWVLSDRLPLFMYSTLDPQQYNYRILIGNATEVIKGTPCDSNLIQN